MLRRLRHEELGFVESAPIRLVFTREIAAPPDAVFTALAEDVTGWTDWFSAVTRAEPVEGASPGRRILLRGGVRFEESVLAADRPERYAYRVDATSAPGLRALVEEWRLTPAGTGTRMRWTFAADGPALFRVLLRAARPALGRSFRDAVTALDRKLAKG
ncbi:polyketide cyclase [Streptomyces sp. NBRC 14336]|uniref:SRPBCC family protein n=1 Tax=Streptomyces sp. NBRC 14336 TaxID=3030992 RepID=UPI0024A5FC47|nr:SRPBCC family protein [Streptomyces sp. NBRC 14336]GLW46879.1 polyketide cyclase [Streptomyces sp. NBRC 14336]